MSRDRSSARAATLRLTLTVLALLLAGSFARALEQKTTPEAALAALQRAGAYFRDRLGVENTFVWRYSLDGRSRHGEGGEVPASLGWVQPPGTPAVGAAFLRIYEVTGDKSWLDAAHRVAKALVKTQLISGGWFYAIETDREKLKNWCYRARDIGQRDCRKIKGNRKRNETVLDDNNTQSVLNFLMWFDKANKGADPVIRDSIDFGLRRLMASQYRNGAFPAFYSDRVPGFDEAVASHATIPVDWPRDWQKPDSPPYFIVNDNLPRDTGRLFLNAYRAYGEPMYLRTAMEVGDFLVAAQLPAPQPGWAQQYDRLLQPVWGRNFEPPAVASRETAGCIDYLVELHDQTAKAQYLDVAKSAAQWLTDARLPDGSWARHYEINTNRPLFINSKGEVTFEDKDLTDDYGTKGAFDIEATLTRLLTEQDQQQRPTYWLSTADRLGPSELTAEAKRLVESQDAEGRWTDGDWIDGHQFVDGVFTLARFISQPAEEEQSE
jgi:hypothetical protein